MSWQVEYTARNGKRALSPVFGSDVAAAAYARTVKDPKMVPSAVPAPAVDAQRLPEAHDPTVGETLDYLAREARKERARIEDLEAIRRALGSAQEQHRKDPQR